MYFTCIYTVCNPFIGASGLTAGNLLARSGLKVLILEKHYNTGGGTHSWEDKGYEWDTGIHYVGSCIQADSGSSTGKVLRFLTDDKLKWESIGELIDVIKLKERDLNATI